MHFEASDVVTHPPALVLETLIERMEEIVPFLDNIDSIEMLERSNTAGGRIRIVRRWQASARNVPSLIRPFLTPDLLAWIDTALWIPDRYRVEWTQSSCSAGATQLYSCSGVNSFEPTQGNAAQTQIRITGDLLIHPDRLPGVPRILGSRIAPQVEGFLIGLITPNLTGLAQGLQRYFSAGKTASRATGRRKRK